jgi:hypothetical protein
VVQMLNGRWLGSSLFLVASTLKGARKRTVITDNLLVTVGA